MSQTFWDVRITGGNDKRVIGLWCNCIPLRRQQAEEMAEQEKADGREVEIVPTRDKGWEATYGDNP